LLEHLGRKDARVKIRGFRVEPSEVQNAIGQLPSVDRAVVVPIDQPGRGTFLAAFVVSKHAAKPTVSSLRQQLRLMLPDHMIPSVIQFVDQIPLTLHGKVDRENLRNAFSAAQRGLARDLPQTEMEKRVAGIWAEVFDLPQIGRSADFFELGGDSLTAAVTAARIFQELGTEIELGFFNLHPRLADFAQAIEAVGAPTAMRTEVGAEASERPKAAPLTLAQERIWRLCQTPAKNAKYVRASIHVIEGKLDVDVLRDCMTYLERRHEILHTSFEISNGGPVQIVNAPGPTPLRVVDLSKAPDVEGELAALKDRESSRQFDLAKPPLFHFTLARLRDQEFALIRSYHYIIGDGPSWRRYHRELALLYEAKMAGDAPPLPDTMAFRYADYAVWQRKELSHGTPRYREFMDWWRDQFSRISNPVDLPYLRICPVPFASPEEGYLHWHLSTEATQHLARLAIESGTTFFVTRLAAYVALLCHDAGTPDLAVGTYFGKRRGPAGQELLGLFANLTPLVFHYNSTLTFRAWLSVVQLVVAEAERRCEIPYEEICEVVAADGCSAQVRVLIINGADHSSERFAGLTLQSRRGARIGPMPWGMTLYPDERYEENAHLAFDARNYNPAAVRDFVDRYQTLLEQAARKPDMLLSALVASRTRRRAETPRLRLARLVRSLGRATLSVGRALRNSRA
jgi:hypothetical protein